MSSPFDKHRDSLERHETMMGPARGRLAVALDLLTDSLALVGQHGVYCQSTRHPGKPTLDIAVVLEQIGDAQAVPPGLVAIREADAAARVLEAVAKSDHVTGSTSAVGDAIAAAVQGEN